MRIAALYDIHANYPALRAVIDSIADLGVDCLVVGGDILPGPMPAECFDQLARLDIPVHTLIGNGDREVLARLLGVETDWYKSAKQAWRVPVDWTAAQLTPEHGRMLTRLPKTLELVSPNLGPILFCHATPINDADCFTELTDESKLSWMFDDVDARLVVCGHTHMQFDRMIGPRRVINAGSVGMPIGRSGAFWLLLGDQPRLMRSEFDLQGAAAQIRNTDYPQAETFVQQCIFDPPPEAVMLKTYAQAEDTWSGSPSPPN